METMRVTRESIARKTLSQFGTERLVALCKAARTGDRSGEFIELFQRMLRPWGDRFIGDRPRFPSNVADDGAPYEFSLGLSPGPAQVQVYVEAQGEPPSWRANMHAGRLLLDRVAYHHALSLERLHLLEPLFFPEEPCGPFSIWVGASLSSNMGLSFKVYLNPQVKGAARAGDLLADAMDRLGFDAAWTEVQRALDAAAPAHELGIVCLDLSPAADARAKVYVRLPRATVDDIGAIARLAKDFEGADLAAFYSTTARSAGPFAKKPTIVELSFVSADTTRPSSVTFEFPIGSYVATDETARERTRACLRYFGLPTDTYDSAILGFCTRPLAEGGGLHEHLTFRRIEGEPRVALYLASEAYLRPGSRFRA